MEFNQGVGRLRRIVAVAAVFIGLQDVQPFFKSAAKQVLVVVSTFFFAMEFIMANALDSVSDVLQCLRAGCQGIIEINRPWPVSV